MAGLMRPRELSPHGAPSLVLRTMELTFPDAVAPLADCLCGCDNSFLTLEPGVILLLLVTLQGHRS